MSAQAEARTPWIINPGVDYLFVCGGALWIVAAAHLLAERFGGATALAGLAMLATALTQVSSNAHTASTLIRIYGDRTERSALFLYTVLLWLPMLALTAGGFVVDGMAEVLLKVYLLWVLQHYAGQTFGFVMIYCQKRGYRLDETTRQALHWVFTLSWVVAVARQLAWRGWGSQRFLGVQVPFWGVLPTWAPWAAGAAFLATLGFTVWRLVQIGRSTGAAPPLPAVALTLSYFGLTFAGGAASQLLWIYVPMLFHGSQYVLLSASFHLRSRGYAGIFGWAGLGYFALATAGGAVIYKLLPFLAGQAGVERAAGLVTIFAVANLHHFLTDRAIWRLRDPAVRALLLT